MGILVLVIDIKCYYRASKRKERHTLITVLRPCGRRDVCHILWLISLFIALAPEQSGKFKCRLQFCTQYVANSPLPLATFFPDVVRSNEPCQPQ